ncbi:hypothetical protein KHQ06_08135 [Nocardia tengchongensis]|uniref:DUF5919 domain-containing protein n=1 Tax=Nocardia tengchongensis TaxID=2055889 RepID=A0ABX8CUA2_9NOCA|nr:DUF5919 domain-containing protein [Nocardia tengchongensis]QVI22921.1 hypothetical protein KHQ06_08135 [Nocardia tengchongensis]
MGTVLRALLQQRHLQTVSAFNREYDRLAQKIDPTLVGFGPKKAQFYRWLSGEISGLPYPDHCRILQGMFPNWSIDELFESYSGSPEDLVRAPRATAQTAKAQNGRDLADVEAVYATRLDFLRAMPPQELFKTARTVDLAGLSLNMLCQQYSDTDILRLLENGTVIRCLFLDPAGTSIRAREIEEGHPSGLLTNLTDANIRTLERVRRRVTPQTPGSLLIKVYDQPIRFNITIIDSTICVMQPYLPSARGVESPTFVSRKSGAAGLYGTFSEVFEGMWADGNERATA